MSTHTVQLHWERLEQAFSDRRYSRRHTWRFDGGAVVSGSSSPQVVPSPMSDPAAVDPEEAFVASLSSCHLLWFLDLAQRAGWVVDDYRDEPVGAMGRDDQGRMAVTRVTLRPVVRFSGDRCPNAAEHRRLHEAAHAACFIANSVRSEILCEPVLAPER
jgi:organic hydroperoxide reductase OsmC/OhrA